MSAQLWLFPDSKQSFLLDTLLQPTTTQEHFRDNSGLFKRFVTVSLTNSWTTVVAVVWSKPSLLTYVICQLKKASLFAVTVSSTNTTAGHLLRKQEFRGGRRGSHYLISQNRKRGRRKGDNTKGRGVSDRLGNNTQSHV